MITAKIQPLSLFRDKEEKIKNFLTLLRKESPTAYDSTLFNYSIFLRYHNIMIATKS